MKSAYNKIYIIIISIFCMLLFLSPTNQMHVFFNSGRDFAADFFNICIYVAGGDPYGNLVNGPTEHGALPLTYLYQYPFTLFTNFEVLSLKDCYNNMGAMIPFVVYMVICISFFVYSIMELAKYYRVSKKYIWPIFFSSIFLFTIERGNSILLMASLVNLFIVYYNSNMRYKKVLAIFFLSIVGIFKIIPGILCLLYLRDRRYKEFCLLGVVTFILLIIPFFFFKGGISNIFVIPERMALQVETYGRLMTSYRFGFMSLACFANYIFNGEWVYFVSKIISYVFLGMSIFFFWFDTNRKESYIYLMFILALYAGSANVYNDLYLFPLYIMLFSEQVSFKGSNLYLLLFLFIMQPIQIILHGQSISYMVANISSVFLWTLLLVDGLKKIRQSY